MVLVHGRSMADASLHDAAIRLDRRRSFDSIFETTTHIERGCRSHTVSVLALRRQVCGDSIESCCVVDSDRWSHGGVQSLGS